MSRKLVPPVWFLGALLSMVALNLVAPGPRWIGWPWRYAGLAPFALGLFLVAWPAGLFRRAGTTIKPGKPSTFLVTGGPYRVSRNPIYLGLVLALVGVWILMGTLTPIFVVPLFALAIDRLFITMEERMLRERFGEEYEAYTKHVRRWL